MLSWKMRTALVLCGTTLVLAGSPAKSHAIFDWLCPWAKKDQTASTTYVPPFSGRTLVAAPGTAVAPIVTGVPPVVGTMPTTCSYVPQTCYRTVYRPVQVTSCTPMRSYDPCTGYPVVAYRPVTSWTQRTMLQPYTTYRIVYSTTTLRAVPGCPTPACAGACGYTPGMCGFTGGIAAPGCSSCASGMSPPSIPPSTRISPVPMSSPQATYPGATRPSNPAAGPQNLWTGASAAQPVRALPDNSQGVTLPWPDTRQSPAAQPDSLKPSPLAPVLNAPNNEQPPVRPVRQASYSQPTDPPSGGAPRVTLRLGADGWEPVR